mgnify:CR=1 FL=1
MFSCLDAHFEFFTPFKAQLEIKEQLISFEQTVAKIEATGLMDEWNAEESLMIHEFGWLPLLVFE